MTTVAIGLGLLGRGRVLPGRGYALAGILLGLVAAVVMVFAVGVAAGRGWARVGGATAQVLLVVPSLARLAGHPSGTLIGLAIAAIVSLALLVPGRADGAGHRPSPSRPAQSPPPPPWPPGLVEPIRSVPSPGGGAAPVAVVARPPEPAGEQLTAGGALLGLATVLIVLGALAIRSGLIVGMVLLAIIFVPLEKVFTLHPQRVFRSGWHTDVVHFIVNNILTTALLVVPVVGLGTAARAMVPAAARRVIGHQPGVLQGVEVLLLASLCGYWAHRLTHTVPILWRFHQVHHSIQQLDWLAAARLHPIDSVFTKTVTVLPIYALGYTRAALGGFIVFTTFQAIFIHANVRLTFGPLRWLVATPEFHHWHHANEPQAYNTNFAGEFPWVDALFGTLYLPKGSMPARYGIDDDVPTGYLRQLAWPFRSPAQATA